MSSQHSSGAPEFLFNRRDRGVILRNDPSRLTRTRENHLLRTHGVPHTILHTRLRTLTTPKQAIAEIEQSEYYANGSKWIYGIQHAPRSGGHHGRRPNRPNQRGLNIRAFGDILINRGWVGLGFSGRAQVAISTKPSTYRNKPPTSIR